MKRLLVSSVALAVVSTAASAADLPVFEAPVEAPVPAGYTWSGCYVGGHVGYEFGHDSRVPLGGSPSVVESITIFGNLPEALDIDRDGPLGGAQLGCDIQNGPLVLGIVTDISATGSEGDDSELRSPFGPAFPVVTSGSYELEFLGTVRGRIGMAVDRFLVHATGGLAYGEVSLEGEIDPGFPFPTPAYFGEQSDIEVGWTVGGGVAYAVTDRVSVGVDYLYYDLGEQTLTLTETSGLAPGEFATQEFDTNGSIIRGLVNFHF